MLHSAFPIRTPISMSRGAGNVLQLVTDMRLASLRCRRIQSVHEINHRIVNTAVC